MNINRTNLALVVLGGAVGFVIACAGMNTKHQTLAYAETTVAAGESRTISAPQAPPRSSPIKALGDRDVYYPGTEDLAPDEMRVIACGTGMPNARPKQAALLFACTRA